MANVKLPSYLLPSNFVFDKQSGEMYMIQRSTYASNDDIARRLARNTEASKSKLFKWQRKDSRGRKAIIVNKNPVFDAVSQEKAASIGERLSRPTKATTRRHNDSDKGSDCGSVTSLPVRQHSSASSRTSVRIRKPLSVVPRPSARPERPILVSSPLRREKPDTRGRNVRFQSPMPAQGSHVETSARVAVSTARQSDSERHSMRSGGNTGRSEPVTSVSERVREHSSENLSTGEVTPPHDSPVIENDDQEHVAEPGPKQQPSATKRIASPKSTSTAQLSPVPSPPPSPAVASNKNMQLVFDYFSKLPGITSEDESV